MISNIFPFHHSIPHSNIPFHRLETLIATQTRCTLIMRRVQVAIESQVASQLLYKCRDMQAQGLLAVSCNGPMHNCVIICRQAWEFSVGLFRRYCISITIESKYVESIAIACIQPSARQGRYACQSIFYYVYKAEKLTVCPFICTFLVGLISQSGVYESMSDLLIGIAVFSGMVKFIYLYS